MAVVKKNRAVYFYLRKLCNTFVPADEMTAELMESIPANDENYFELRTLTKKDVRSAAQNRLMWIWITDASKTTVNEWSGRTKEEWHYELKKRFLVPIYERDNEGYALMLVSLRRVFKSGLVAESETLHRHIVSETSTTQATVEQFTEYLNEISRFFGMSGISLRTDNRLWDLAMRPTIL